MTIHNFTICSTLLQNMFNYLSGCFHYFVVIIYLTIKLYTLFFRRAVVCPIIDVISDETFEYMAGSDMTYGGFNWKLNFRWYPVPQREMDRRKGDRTLPVRYTKNMHHFCT